jgi:hypothetical protein
MAQDNLIVTMMRQMVREALAEALGTSASPAADAAPVIAALDSGEPIAEPRSANRVTRRRRATRPAVGYHLNVDKRAATAALKNLAHNPAAVLGEIIRKAGQTNREITASLGDEVGGKKAVESALYFLRTVDATGARLNLDKPADRKRALVVSRPLESE